MEDAAAYAPRDSGQRPGSPSGDRAVVVPGEDARPPRAWAPAVLAAHAALLSAVVVVGMVSRGLGVESYRNDFELVGPPAWVKLSSLAVAVLTVVLIVRRVGPRHPARLNYWLSGTTCWVIVPFAWMAVGTAVTVPESAGWYVILFFLTPYGLVYIVPALVIGGVWTGVLARMNS